MSNILATVERAQLIAAFVGLVVMLLWENAHPFFELFRASKHERSVHLIRNLSIGALNSV